MGVSSAAATPVATNESPRAYRRPDRWSDAELIDCDVHVGVPSLDALHPYLDERWRDYLLESGVSSLAAQDHPPKAPISVRPDLSVSDLSSAISGLDVVTRNLLEPWSPRYAVVNCGYGIPALHNDDLAAAIAGAVNDWQDATWLSADERLRGSIVVPAQNPELAALEIERSSGHAGFVQVLLPARAETPLGKRRYWPIYEAAQRHGLAVGIYAGGASGNPITGAGWPSYYLEDYIGFAQAFQTQVVSLVSEGVFAKFPHLEVVLIEGGFTWLPSLMWRFDKNWKGLRREVPWVDELPSEVIRRHIRLTTQPLDDPQDPGQLLKVVDQMGSDDMLLFSTDYPHWHFDSGEESLPAGLRPELERKILAHNARATYRFDRRG